MTTTDSTEIVAEQDPGARIRAARVRMPGYDTELGPIAHLADERQRLADLEWEHFDAHPMAATIGAEISGLDLTSELDEGVIAELQQALWDYKVIFFRDQPVTPQQHAAFAARFGPLEIHPFIPSNTGVPELVRFSKSADVGGYENGWHHDVTWRAEPSKAAILHAIDVPATGGDTLFCDMYAAYEGLDDETKALIEDLTVVHDAMMAFGGQVPDDRKAEMREKYPEVEHPAVCTHDDTGRRHLYLNRFFVSRIEGMDRDEGLALVDRLCAQSDLVEYQCRFQWQPDSIAFWDNRAVQHYAASDYWPDVRVMERASIKGTRPHR